MIKTINHSFRDELPVGLRWASPVLEYAIGLSRAKHLCAAHVELDAAEFSRKVLDELAVQVVWREEELLRIPRKGPLLVIANHHYGAIDALILLSLILRVRTDTRIVGSNTLLLLPPLASILIPVFSDRINIRPARQIYEHFESEGCLVLFPAGKVAGELRRGQPVDYGWSPAFAKLVRRFQAAVMPIAIAGGHSRFFYSLRKINFGLSRMLLIREQLNKTGKRIEVHIGAMVSYELSAKFDSNDHLVEFLRAATYELIHAR